MSSFLELGPHLGDPRPHSTPSSHVGGLSDSTGDHDVLSIPPTPPREAPLAESPRRLQHHGAGTARRDSRSNRLYSGEAPSFSSVDTGGSQLSESCPLPHFGEAVAPRPPTYPPPTGDAGYVYTQGDNLVLVSGKRKVHHHGSNVAPKPLTPPAPMQHVSSRSGAIRSMLDDDFDDGVFDFNSMEAGTAGGGELRRQMVEGRSRNVEEGMDGSDNEDFGFQPAGHAILRHAPKRFANSLVDVENDEVAARLAMCVTYWLGVKKVLQKRTLLQMLWDATGRVTRYEILVLMSLRNLQVAEHVERFLLLQEPYRRFVVESNCTTKRMTLLTKAAKDFRSSLQDEQKRCRGAFRDLFKLLAHEVKKRTAIETNRSRFISSGTVVVEQEEMACRGRMYVTGDWLRDHVAFSVALFGETMQSVARLHVTFERGTRVTREEESARLSIEGHLVSEHIRLIELLYRFCERLRGSKRIVSVFVLEQESAYKEVAAIVADPTTAQAKVVLAQVALVCELVEYEQDVRGGVVASQAEESIDFVGGAWEMDWRLLADSALQEHLRFLLGLCLAAPRSLAGDVLPMEQRRAIENGHQGLLFAKALLRQHAEHSAKLMTRLCDLHASREEDAEAFLVVRRAQTALVEDYEPAERNFLQKVEHFQFCVLVRFVELVDEEAVALQEDAEIAHSELRLALARWQRRHEVYTMAVASAASTIWRSELHEREGLRRYQVSVNESVARILLEDKVDDILCDADDEFMASCVASPQHDLSSVEAAARFNILNTYERELEDMYTLPMFNGCSWNVVSAVHDEHVGRLAIKRLQIKMLGTLREQRDIEYWKISDVSLEKLSHQIVLESYEEMCLRVAATKIQAKFRAIRAVESMIDDFDASYV